LFLTFTIGEKSLIIMLNEYGEVLVCCGVDRLSRTYSIGKLLGSGVEEVISGRHSERSEESHFL
jgi:hypothetical protein